MTKDEFTDRLLADGWTQIGDIFYKVDLVGGIGTKDEWIEIDTERMRDAVAIQEVSSRLRRSQDIEAIIDRELKYCAKRTTGYEGEFDSRTEYEYQSIDVDGTPQFYEDGSPIMITRISAYYKITEIEGGE